VDHGHTEENTCSEAVETLEPKLFSFVFLFILLDGDSSRDEPKPTQEEHDENHDYFEVESLCFFSS